MAKQESRNPGRRVKDRICLNMIEDAERKRQIGRGTTIIEPIGGNTGIGLAMTVAVKGYRLILAMPETMSIERRTVLAACGAELVLTPGSKGMRGAIEKVEELASSTPNSFVPQQFKNHANPCVHKETTGLKVWRATDGKADILVAGVGMGGGTITE